MTVASILLFSALIALGATSPVRLTGNVVADFNLSSTGVTETGVEYGDVLVAIDGDSFSKPLTIEQAVPDVTMPATFADGTISGWDLRSIRVQYDFVNDKLFIGIDCFGICGDADGDGDAGRTGAALAGLGGVDMPNLAGGESFAMAFSLDLNVANFLPAFTPNIEVPWNVMLGIPAVDATVASHLTLPCLAGKSATDANFADVASCFGLYEYLDVTDIPFASRFGAPQLLNGQPWPVSYYASPTVGLEWTISNVTALRSLYVSDAYTRPLDPTMPWAFLTQVYAGSTADATIGDDFIPNANNYINFQFPCYSCCPFDKNGPAGGTFLLKDVCGVCGGDGSSCATSTVVVAASTGSPSGTAESSTTTKTVTANTPGQPTVTDTVPIGATKAVCPLCRQGAQCGPHSQIDANGCVACDRCVKSLFDEASAGAAVRVTLVSLLFVGASMVM